MDFGFNEAEIQRRIQELSKNIQKNVRKEIGIELEKGALRIEADAAKNAPVNLGDLRGSIESREAVSGSQDVIKWEVKVNAPQGIYIEFGTKPHWAPIDPLIDWVLQKRIASDENEAFLIADAIQAKIAKRGTLPQPFFRPAFFKNEEKIKKDIQRALQRAMKKGGSN